MTEDPTKIVNEFIQEFQEEHEHEPVSDDVEAELNELARLGLPNLYEAAETANLIQSGRIEPRRQLGVRVPLPGRFTEREGERLKRGELLPLVDQWLEAFRTYPLFVIQGGNRYISEYIRAKGITVSDIKVMSIDKAPLYNQLLTALSPKERDELIEVAYPDEVGKARKLSGTRVEVLKQIAGQTLLSPFRSPTRDEDLEAELEEAVEQIKNGAINIPDLMVVQDILSTTQLAQTLKTNKELHFIDDLFYRGRTLYSLAVIVQAFGGDPQKIRLTTLNCDSKSKDLKSPYHQVMKPDTLYPFENSVRTEQGYWQNAGDMHIFTDMGAYWEYLDAKVNPKESLKLYEKWEQHLQSWYGSFSLVDADTSLSMPLVWLNVFHTAFGIEVDVNRIIDQKGDKIGACAPFAQLLDRFISQEEPVEQRLLFKQQVRDILAIIDRARAVDPTGYDLLVQEYLSNQDALDYAGLSQLFESDNDEYERLEEPMTFERMVQLLSNTIHVKALSMERPLIVGINGVDGVGKTEITKVLGGILGERQIPVTTIHIDSFTNPTQVRHSSPNQVENYLSRTFDTNSLVEQLLAPIRSGQLPNVTLRHVDPLNDEMPVQHNYEINEAPSVVLVEGVFLFSKDMTDYFDYRIFLRMPITSMPGRATLRDVPKFGAQVLAKYTSKYIPAQRQYLHAAEPELAANVIVDYDDWEQPEVTIRKGSR